MLRIANLTLFCGISMGMLLPSLLPGLHAAIKKHSDLRGIADMMLTNLGARTTS